MSSTSSYGRLLMRPEAHIITASELAAPSLGRLRRMGLDTPTIAADLLGTVRETLEPAAYGRGSPLSPCPATTVTTTACFLRLASTGLSVEQAHRYRESDACCHQR
jgi:hypothetical protein